MRPQAATAIEYGLIASLISGVIITSVNGVGDVLNKNYFMKIRSLLNSGETSNKLGPEVFKHGGKRVATEIEI